MKKTMLFIILLAFSTAYAQESSRAYAFVTAYGQACNVSYSLGETFFTQRGNAEGWEVAAGVQQAQLLHETIDTALCQNDVQPIYSFDFHSLDADGNLIPEGRYDSSHYCQSFLNYDSLTDITLTVWPIYEGWDTLYLSHQEMLDAQFPNPGRNDKLLKTSNDCDSLMHYMVYVCGFPDVTDYDDNIYGNTWVGDECWTSSNMRTTHYVDGRNAPNMVYSSLEHTDANRMVDTYGRLYTWYAAVDVPENSTDTPSQTNEGFVQGICPTGWHLPTSRNMADLTVYPSEWLKSDSLWLHPGDNHIDMDVRPAGWYNAENQRFENLLGYTHFWTDVQVNSFLATLCTLMDGCNDLIVSDQLKRYGLSVRCVKDNVYSETTWGELRKKPTK